MHLVSDLYGFGDLSFAVMVFPFSRLFEVLVLVNNLRHLAVDHFLRLLCLRFFLDRLETVRSF